MKSIRKENSFILDDENSIPGTCRNNQYKIGRRTTMQSIYKFNYKGNNSNNGCMLQMLTVIFRSRDIFSAYLITQNLIIFS